MGNARAPSLERDAPSSVGRRSPKRPAPVQEHRAGFDTPSRASRNITRLLSGRSCSKGPCPLGLLLLLPEQLPQHAHARHHTSLVTQVLIALLLGPCTQELLGVRDECELETNRALPCRADIRQTASAKNALTTLSACVRDAEADTASCTTKARHLLRYVDGLSS